MYTYTLHSCVCVCVCMFYLFLLDTVLHMSNQLIVVLFSLPLRGADDIVSRRNASGGRQPRSDSTVECFTSLLFLYLYILPVSTGQKHSAQQLSRLKITCLRDGFSISKGWITHPASFVSFVLELVRFPAMLALPCFIAEVRSTKTGLRYSSCCRLLLAVTLEVWMGHLQGNSWIYCQYRM